ncbi:hypothetical protein GUJ93_ZPchr0004g38337 [Zizania palustris]|uniref:Uncharacterized protein n=1 Tax=Zizania palustris TaxID=103762 RepID=A0A8J5S105_ZIZPA|nr:hypothetical protein GUJ93_ZPchr0004g38337 [Zizania palustris]
MRRAKTRALNSVVRSYDSTDDDEVDPVPQSLSLPIDEDDAEPEKDEYTRQVLTWEGAATVCPVAVASGEKPGVVGDDYGWTHLESSARGKAVATRMTWWKRRALLHRRAAKASD